MNQLWQMWSAGLGSETVSEIITECEFYKVSDANLGFNGEVQNEGYRVSELRWIDNRDPNSKFIVDLLWDFAKEANKNAFGFYIDHISEIQYTTYKAEKNAHYDWHFDTFWANPTAYDRKLSIVVQLSDPNDYEGGLFEFDEQYPAPDKTQLKEKGTVLVFPSFIRHRVTPVTSGVRKSLVTWIQGPKFR